MNAIRTIGHSNHPIERFVGLLKAGGVALLVDVRSLPYSRRFPQFDKARLGKSLSDSGIGYLWEGAALGGRPNDGGSYETLATRPDFQDALGRVIERGTGATLCLMCAEKEPLECHRTMLVSRRLAERGATIEHLLADGTVRAHVEIEEALLKKSGGADLFADRATRLAQAYQARERAMKGS